MDVPVKLVENIAVSRGVILHSTMFKTIGHGKFFVVIGVSDDMVAGFFFVNSNINGHIQNKPELLAMQYPMKHSDYGFLKYDSFLSATEIMQVSCAKLAPSIKNGETTIKGYMRAEHLEELLEAARASKLFSKKEKQMFLY